MLLDRSTFDQATQYQLNKYCYKLSGMQMDLCDKGQLRFHQPKLKLIKIQVTIPFSLILRFFTLCFSRTVFTNIFFGSTTTVSIHFLLLRFAYVIKTKCQMRQRERVTRFALNTETKYNIQGHKCCSFVALWLSVWRNHSSNHNGREKIPRLNLSIDLIIVFYLLMN